MASFAQLASRQELLDLWCEDTAAGPGGFNGYRP